MELARHLVWVILTTLIKHEQHVTLAAYFERSTPLLRISVQATDGKKKKKNQQQYEKPLKFTCKKVQQTKNRTHLLFGFCGVTLDRLPCYQAFQGILNCAYLVRLDIQLQSEKRLQSSRLLRTLLVNNRSMESKKVKNYIYITIFKQQSST